MTTIRKIWLAAVVLPMVLAGSLAYSQSAPKMEPDAKKKAGKQTAAPTTPVDINTASMQDLVAVKGIGPATAKKIIAGRPYGSIQDLSKAGLNAKQISDLTPSLKISSIPAAKTTPMPTPAPKQNQAAAPTTPTMTPSTNSSSPSAAAAAGGGPGMVWVNSESKVFHRQNDRWYGRTKQGRYMTEADALKSGAHESKEKESSKKPK